MRRILVVALAASAAACGAYWDDYPKRSFVGGTVTGLEGSGLVLRNKASDSAWPDDVEVAAPGGAFAFRTSLAQGASYAITVQEQPSSPRQTCTVANGSGTIGGVDVASVAVKCETDQGDPCAGVTCTASDGCHVAGRCSQGVCSPETPVQCPAGQTCDVADGSCKPTRVPLTAVSVADTTVEVSRSVALAVTYTPANATDRSLTWTVCTAQPSGSPLACTPGAPGTFGTITSAGVYDAPASVPTSPFRVHVLACQGAVCDGAAVDVTTAVVPLTAIAVADASVETSAAVTLAVTYTPPDATDRSLAWTVCTAQPSGSPLACTPGAPGTYGSITSAGVYTAPASVSSSPFRVHILACQGAVCDDAAVDVRTPVIPLTAISIANATVEVSRSVTFGVTYTPSNATDRSLTWTVCTAQPSGSPLTCTPGSAATYGTVTAGGVYTAPPSVPSSPFRVHVLACQNSVCDWASVDVTRAVVPLTAISVADATVEVSRSVALGVTYTPANATDRSLTWTVCTAQPTGSPLTCTPGAPRTYGTISAAGAYTAPASVPSSPFHAYVLACQNAICDWASVTVTVPLNGISIANATVPVAREVALAVAYTPPDVTDRSLAWRVCTAQPIGSPLTCTTGDAGVYGTVSGAGVYTAPASIATPPSFRVHVLACQNAVCASAWVDVTSPPVIASFTATPQTIVVEESSSLSWAVTGATSLSISPSPGAVAGTSVDVLPTATTTYVLTATNAYGSSTASVTVGVAPLTAGVSGSLTMTGYLWADPTSGRTVLRCDFSNTLTNRGGETVTTSQATYQFVTLCTNSASYPVSISVPGGATRSWGTLAYCGPTIGRFTFYETFSYTSSSHPATMSAVTPIVTCLPPPLLGAPTLARAARSLALDLDGDGNPDAVAVDRAAGEVAILLGKGDGSFRSPVRHPAGEGPVSAAAADVDGDGTLDLLVVNEISNDVTVLLGNGDGSFRPAPRQPVGAHPSHLAVGDVDGDGHPDVLVTNAHANTVSVLLGAGDGTFRGAPDLAAGDGPVGVALGDLDGDGTLDALVVNIGSSTLSVFRGRGNGRFEAWPSVQLAPSSGPGAIALADVDGDGRLDVVAASETLSTALVLLGDGTGSFRLASAPATGADPVTVALADLDGDGHVDIATADLGDGTVSVLRGRGDGTFAAAEHFPAAGARSLAIADFDRDGLPDVAAAAASGSLTLVRGRAIVGATPDESGP